jgi:RNA polymerase sigma factor (sigma-70 family)
MHGLPQTALAHQHVWIAEKIAARYVHVAPTADLRAAGALGLAEAASRFQPRRGLRFSTYAWPWVKGAVLAELRRNHVVPVAEWTARKDSREGRSPRVVVVFGALDTDKGGATDDADQEEAADRDMRLRGVRIAVSRLADPGHRRVIEATLEGRTPEQIGEDLGLCEERVRQLLREATNEIRTELWDDTMDEDRMDEDELTSTDIAKIQDPNFYRTAQPLVRRLAVAVLEARNADDPSAATVAANERVLAAHEEQRRLSDELARARQTIDNQRERIAKLEGLLQTERERSKKARAATFARQNAAECRALLRQALKALQP